MTHKIQAPVADFTGTVVGVDFKNGQGETDNAAALEYFERQGYEIEANEAETKLTPKQLLQAEAVKLGLSDDGTSAELIARIADAKTKTPETETKPSDPSTETKPADPSAAPAADEKK